MTRRGAIISSAKSIPSAARPGAMPQLTGAPYYGGVSPLQRDLDSGGASPGDWARTYGAFLPRPPEDFTEGAFGPFSPVLPVPVDQPGPGEERAPARVIDYRVGWNLPVGQPGSEGIKLADFSTLRTLADLYSVARACIQLRKAEVRGLEWDIMPTPDAAKAMRGDKDGMRDFGERRAKAIRFFKRPDPNYLNWSSWVDAVLEEVFVFDALSLLMRPKWGRRLGKGLLGSDLDSLQLISGPTIRPLYDMHGGLPRPPAPAYQQYLYGVPRTDLMTMITERDIEDGQLSGSEINDFRGDQLLYLRTSPRVWTPYGFPPIERALVPVMSGLNKQGYQLDFYKEGTVPAVYVSPGGTNGAMSTNQIRELQDALNAIAGDPAWKHKIIVLPADSRVEPQRPPQLADQFDEIVMNQVCMAFEVQPMELGIMPRVSTTSSPGAANQMAKSSSNAHDRNATLPLLMFLSDVFTTILSDVCHQEDMRFVFEGLEVDEDEETQTTMLVQQISNALRSVDEARDELGLQPWGLPETSDPGFLTPTGFVPIGQVSASGQPEGQQPDATHPAVAAPPGQQPPGGGGATGPGAPGGQRPGPSKPSPSKPASDASQSPGHEAAEGAEGARQKPAGSASSTSASAAKAATLALLTAPNEVAAAGQPYVLAAPQSEQPPAQPPVDGQQPDTVRDVVLALIAAWVAKELTELMTRLYLGHVMMLDAVERGVGIMSMGYARALTAGSRAAATQFGGTEAPDVTALAGAHAAAQRDYLIGLASATQKAAETQAGTDWLPARAALYGATLTAAYEEGRGSAVQAAEPDAEIIWRLGDAEHCPLCVARDGRSFTFDTLPGWPGDGGFGGPICLGGPNCACHLDYREGGETVSQGGNTQRPEAPGYYAEQLRDITARREQMRAEREAFVAALPNQPGKDGTSTQMRAQARDDLRATLANLLNQRLRQAGGYGGVTVEPQDIPASIIASLLPQYGAPPADASITALMNAVDQMFAGKLATLDVTRSALTAMLISALAELEKTTPPPAGQTGPDRRVAAELEALARHVEKGRSPATWERRHITEGQVAVVASLLRTGTVTRADAVKTALRDGEAASTAAGRGGPELLPHDADGVQHDPNDDGETDEIADADLGKGASDYTDPNPVEAEHVVNQMRRNYPEKALGWMRDARWLGPVQVPQDRIDYDDETKWAAAHETGRVSHFAKQIKKGKAHLHPVVAVQEPGDDKIKIIDGHHRTLAYRKLGRPVTAYVGLVDRDGGPWDETHAFQDHAGADPANKGETTGKARSYELDPRSGMISLDLPPGIITPVPGGVDDHHVTVIYLGPDVDDETWHGALTAASEVAGATPQLSGVVSGLGTFPAGKDGVPAYAEVALPGVAELHAQLAHLQHESAAAHAHGYTPHVTLAYLADGDEPPAPVPATPVTFTELSAHRGDEVWRFPFVDGEGTDAASATKVGPKGYEHGWVHVGTSDVGSHGDADTRPAAWKPSMTPDEAHAWTRDSVIKEDLYHASASEHVPALMHEGFNLAKSSGEGSVYGTGVYLASDLPSVERYHKPGSTLLTMRVNVKKPLTVEVGTLNPGLNAREQILEKTGPKGRNAFRRSIIERGMKDPGKDGAKWVDDAKATTAALQAAGYDALVVRGKTAAASLHQAVGGNQVIVFDPKNVTVVREPESTKSPTLGKADHGGEGHDSAERLREYWTHGEGAAKIRWGEPGDFDRCVRHLGKFIADPKGYCNLRHHDALGIYPATHAKEERGGKTLLPLIVKVGPEGYIHGFICVRPPCGKGGAEPHTFTKKTGQVHHGDGTYIGKVYGKGGKFWGSHNGGGIGQGKMKLGATYDSAADAATSVAHYHNLHLLAAEAMKRHLPIASNHLTKAHQALSAGNAKLAGEHIAVAHERALDTMGGESHPLLDSLAEEHRAFDQFHGLEHKEPTSAPSTPMPTLKPAAKPFIPSSTGPVTPVTTPLAKKVPYKKPEPGPTTTAAEATVVPAKKAPAKKPAKAIDASELANRAAALHGKTDEKLQAAYLPMQMREDYEQMSPADKLRKGDYLGALGDLHALEQLEKTQVYGPNQGKEYAALRRDVLKAHAASQAGMTRTEKIAALHDYAKNLQAQGKLSHKNGSFGVSQVMSHLESAHFSSTMAESAGSDSLGNVVENLDAAAAKLTPYKYNTQKSMVGNTLAVRDVAKQLSKEISGPVSKTPPKAKPEDLPAGHLHPGVKGAVGSAKADELLTTNPRTGEKTIAAGQAKTAVAERLALELRDVSVADLSRVASYISGGHGSTMPQDVIDHPENYRYNVKTKQYVSVAQLADDRKKLSDLLASIDKAPAGKIHDESTDIPNVTMLLRGPLGTVDSNVAADVLRGRQLYRRSSDGDYSTFYGKIPDGYAAVDPQEARSFARSMVQQTLKSVDDTHVGMDDPRATADAKAGAISKMISQWAQSSNNQHDVALAIQRAATAEFNLEDPAPWHLEKGDLKDRVDQIYNENEATLRRFVRAQYDMTQRDLAKAGVTHVNLYRAFSWGSSSQVPDWARGKDGGVSGVKSVAEKGEHISPVFRPLSSWSSASAQAGKFFGSYASGSSHKMMIKASVPAERIFSYPQSGYGCLEEKEFVVLHSPGLVEVSKSAG